LLRWHYTHAVGARRLLRRDDWLMLPGERAALEGVLSFVEPHLSIEIGTHSGGSLESISAHSAEVHSFDLASHPAVTMERFPNVEFHIGDSHELLPLFLKELEQSGVTVDFAFVDGDHSATGVHRDVVDLLGSSCTRETVILLHDTLNADVRAGLELVDFSTYDTVCFVDLDLVHGRVAKKGQGRTSCCGGSGWSSPAIDSTPSGRPTTPHVSCTPTSLDRWWGRVRSTSHSDTASSSSFTRRSHA
jgi:hypothetical protein